MRTFQNYRVDFQTKNKDKKYFKNLVVFKRKRGRKWYTPSIVFFAMEGKSSKLPHNLQYFIKGYNVVITWNLLWYK